MKVVDLTEELLRSLKVREIERIDLGDNFIDEEPSYLISEFKKAVVNDRGEVVFCFGGQRTHEFGVWAWLLGSDLIQENPVACLEIMRTMHFEAEKIHRELGFKYFYTFNNPAFDFALKFLERLGYQRRDTTQFNDGVDRIILVKEL